MLFYSVSGIFFISGAVALTYQVIWMRILSLFFGSDIHAASIVLSVFMGGLCFGSFLASKWGDHIKRPLLVYGILEILISLCALLIPLYLKEMEDFAKTMYQSFFDTSPWIYNGSRFMISSMALVIPTTLMGATLPLLIRHFGVQEEKFNSSVSLFYSLNTLGALLGALISGFFLLPLLGTSLSLSMAVSLNFLIGSFTLFLALKDKNTFKEYVGSPDVLWKTKNGLILLSVAALTGAGALALEVVWMRILIQSFSSTVYVYTIMLSCFLAGIAFGSARVKRSLTKPDESVRLLFRVELYLALSILWLGMANYMVPSLFGSLTWKLSHLLGGNFSVGSLVAIFYISGMLIMVPSILLGMAFPLTVKIYTTDIVWRAKGTGSIYAANTLGTVIGALMAGFVLLPLLGSKLSLIVISLLFLAAGILVIYRDFYSCIKRYEIGILGITMVSGLILICLPYQSVINYNLQKTTRPHILYHKDGVSTSVDMVENSQGNIIMKIDGNIEADTSLTQRRHFILKAHLPLLLHSEPRDIAVIGLGLGITLSALEKHPTVNKIRVIELSPEIIEAHRYLPKPLGEVLESSKIALRIDDGRNFMAFTQEKFDMITADPIHPRISRVGFLYTREYYEHIRHRLRDNGIVAQWMPLYNISKNSFDVALKTFTAVFPNALLWYVRGHGILIGKKNDSAIDYLTFSKHFLHPGIKEDLFSIQIESPEELLGHLLMDSFHIQSYLNGKSTLPLNTDDNAYLEYHTPFEFLDGPEKLCLLSFALLDGRSMPFLKNTLHKSSIKVITYIENELHVL